MPIKMQLFCNLNINVEFDRSLSTLQSTTFCTKTLNFCLRNYNSILHHRKYHVQDLKIIMARYTCDIDFLYKQIQS